MIQIQGKNYKYGKILYNKKRELGWNLGDNIQTLAIEHIYQAMKIEEKDIEAVQIEDISTYRAKGNYQLILPMQGCFRYLKKNDIFPISKDIKPVFIGYSRSMCGYDKLTQYEPWGRIGCRDEVTMKLLKKKGVDAFLSGCLTICFPRRQEQPKDGKIFLVDTMKGIENYMPEEYRDRLVYVSQETDDGENLEQRAQNLLDQYRREAQLVVTSRLHCASPCMAMGIPVIMVRQYFDSRYEWIGKYTKLYTPDLFETIDWRPMPVELEAAKEMIMQLAMDMLMLKDCTQKSEEVNTFYMEREKENSRTPLRTRCYLRVLAVNPKLAYFVRKKMLRRFTVLNQDKK